MNSEQHRCELGTAQLCFRFAAIVRKLCSLGGKGLQLQGQNLAAAAANPLVFCDITIFKCQEDIFQNILYYLSMNAKIQHFRMKCKSFCDFFVRTKAVYFLDTIVCNFQTISFPTVRNPCGEKRKGITLPTKTMIRNN